MSAAFNFTVAAALLYFRRTHISFRIPLPPLITASLIFVPFAIMILDMPLRREFGWHNMMQLAAIQSIYSLPRPPEDLSIAGTTLNYGWLGWAQLAAIAKLTDTAPTVLFLPVNFAHFCIQVLFMCEASAALCPATQCVTSYVLAFSAGVALLSPGLIDIFRSLNKNYVPRFGEPRITPMFSKHVNMDLMVFALSAVALMIYAMIRAARSRSIGDSRLMPVSALAACLTYPLFLPSCISVGLAFLTSMSIASWFPRWQIATYTRAEIGRMVAAWLTFVVVVAAYLRFLGTDTVSSPVAFWPPSTLKWRIENLAWIFAAVDSLLLVALYKAWRERSGVILLLVAISGGLQFAFAVFLMPEGVQYKFLFVALLVSIPVMSSVIAPWAAKTSLRRLALQGAFAATLIACLATKTYKHQPDLAMAEPLNEATAEVLPRDEVSKSWVQAVRKNTPPDTVLLSAATRRPIAILASRALYVCADNPRTEGGPDPELERIGYSMSCLTELQTVKRYSPREISHRTSVLTNALADQISASDAAAVLAALRALGRPIALHTTGASGFQTWLRESRIGRAIFAAGPDTVWFIDRDDLAARNIATP
jgi:hypothetical protein